MAQVTEHGERRWTSWRDIDREEEFAKLQLMAAAPRSLARIEMAVHNFKKTAVGLGLQIFDRKFEVTRKDLVSVFQERCHAVVEAHEGIEKIVETVITSPSQAERAKTAMSLRFLSQSIAANVQGLSDSIITEMADSRAAIARSERDYSTTAEFELLVNDLCETIMMEVSKIYDVNRRLCDMAAARAAARSSVTSPSGEASPGSQRL